VIITSNRTREVHDALKRRCLFYWIDYPSLEKEQRIVAARIPGIDERLSEQLVAFVQELRKMDLYKLPGVAETLDWATALVALDTQDLTPSVVDDTLGAILKYQDDVIQVRGAGVKTLLAKAGA
jgi:MoxR-like ATPase